VEERIENPGSMRRSLVPAFGSAGEVLRSGSLV
jgi:hypothetical protein